MGSNEANPKDPDAAFAALFVGAFGFRLHDDVYTPAAGLTKVLPGMLPRSIRSNR